MDFSLFEKFYVDNVNDMKNDIHRRFLLIAAIVSMKSPCIRRKYGAVIVKDNNIISTGCNDFVVGRDADTLCTEQNCIREQKNLEHGEDYEGTCFAIHAEDNAIRSANQNDISRSTMYLIGYNCKTNELISGIPCKDCFEKIRNTNIRDLITIGDSFDYLWTFSRK